MSNLRVHKGLRWDGISRHRRRAVPPFGAYPRQASATGLPASWTYTSRIRVSRHWSAPRILNTTTTHTFRTSCADSGGTFIEFKLKRTSFLRRRRAIAPEERIISTIRKICRNIRCARSGKSTHASGSTHSSFLGRITTLLAIFTRCWRAATRRRCRRSRTASSRRRFEGRCRHY